MGLFLEATGDKLGSAVDLLVILFGGIHYRQRRGYFCGGSF
jgi:hypothetical protein